MSTMLFVSLLDWCLRKSCCKLNCYFTNTAVKEIPFFPLHAAAPEKNRKPIPPQNTQLSIRDFQCIRKVHLPSEAVAK